ncbi:lipoprotein [Pseudomonas sp. M47T1]|uniref:hypothetical protein n=1 Tax=unclassified Pseudomonas TaxID=196821 RepID=UPI000260676A|nr:hypothetical protein [Pseudomonas sp. M47T1]EIK96907.1 lipoprotein [Pseudomonas sp. M47T1]
MKRLLWLACALLLSACAARPPLPARLPELALPMQLHVQRLQGSERQDWLLVIQQQDAGLRWSMIDPLGIPVARQLLVNGQWQADGLLPPNPAARELFAALLFALTNQQQLSSMYPSATTAGQTRQLGERWAVRYRAGDDLTLTLAQGLRYEISPLPVEVSP